MPFHTIVNLKIVINVKIKGFIDAICTLIHLKFSPDWFHLDNKANSGIWGKNKYENAFSLFLVLFPRRLFLFPRSIASYNNSKTTISGSDTTIVTSITVDFSSVQSSKIKL